MSFIAGSDWSGPEDAAFLALTSLTIVCTVVSCDVRVQLTHAADEFGRVSLQLDGAHGECVTTLRCHGQDRAGIAVDML